MVKLNPGDWIPVSEVAELLGVTVARVHAIIRDGRLKPTRVGSVYLLLRAEVEAFAKLPRKSGRPTSKKKPAAKKPRKK